MREVSAVKNLRGASRDLAVGSPLIGRRNDTVPKLDVEETAWINAVKEALKKEISREMRTVNAPQKKTRVGMICEGIAWVVSDLRLDKRTGFVGEPVPTSKYTEYGYREVMRQWLDTSTAK